jgi:hypothetical protein
MTKQTARDVDGQVLAREFIDNGQALELLAVGTSTRSVVTDRPRRRILGSTNMSSRAVTEK